MNCKKCNTYLPLPGKDYCVNCVPKIQANQSQDSSGQQAQTQTFQSHGINVVQQQSQSSGGKQQQSISKENG